MSPSFNNAPPKMAIITRKKLSGLGIHAGVLQPDRTVFHSTQERGPHIVTYQEFAANNPVQIEYIIPCSEHQAAMVRIYAELAGNNPYHLLENNCETVANRVAGKSPTSSQVLFCLTAGIVGGMLFASRA